jgi:hypothetical protein
MSNNTAQRWWVRTAARWLARVDGVSSQIRVASLGVTAFSTFSLVLQNSGHGELVVPLGVAGLILVPVYVYLYTEHGVWNQMQRDKQDLSTNFAGPTLRIDDEHIARGIIAGMNGEQLDEQTRQAIKDELDETFAEYRDGMQLE